MVQRGVPPLAQQGGRSEVNVDRPVSLHELFPRMADLLEARARHLQEAAALDQELARLMRQAPALMERHGEGGTLSLHEVASFLGISYSTAYQMARSGAIPVFRVGRRYRVPRSALKALEVGQRPA